MRVDESNHETLQRAYDITGSINKIYWRDAENIDGYIDTDDVMTLMQDLINEYEYKADEVRDLESKEKQEDEYDPHDVWLDHQAGII